MSFANLSGAEDSESKYLLYDQVADWHSTSLYLKEKTCQRSEHLKGDDKCLSESPSMTEKKLASMEPRRTNLIDEEKLNTGVVVMFENDTVHNLCESKLSEDKGIKEEQVLAMISEEEQERLEESETNQLQISHWCKKEKDLLHENCMLQEEIARLRREINTKENRNQQKENKYPEDIEIMKAKNDFLQNALTLKEETLTTTISQYSVQLEVLTAENKMLSSKLEDKNQNQERLETEIESYCCRLATAIQDCGQHQASKRDAELGFERARQEWSHLKEKMNFDMSNLIDENKMLSEKLSNAENEIRSLKMKHRHVEDALRETTLLLEGIQNKEGEVNKHIQKQDSLEERLSQIQNENLLLRQQLDEADKKADNQEKTIINIQEQFIAIVKNQAESKKQSLLLEQKNNELVNKCNYLKERLYKYEKEKAERNETMRQLQELVGTEKKQPVSESSLEATLCYHANLDETQDSKRKSGQIRSQKHETLQKDEEKLEELVNLESYMEMNMLEHSPLKRCEQEDEERASQETAEQLEKINQFIQTQKIAQEKLQRLREENSASMKSQMELGIKDLKFEIGKAKTSQADYSTTELEKYKQLYLEQLKLRESISNEQRKRKIILADVRTRLQEKEQSKSLFTSHTSRPAMESACNGNPNENLGLNRIHVPRETLRIFTSSLLSSDSRMENDLSKVSCSIVFCFCFCFFSFQTSDIILVFFGKILSCLIDLCILNKDPCVFKERKQT
ncbi:ankyrin repeat domain-containing protein 26-like isoform X2 [Saimiri boliviensis]|uniref:ankyrin repeat domain-containing protein 26-like isoform X2 n=1 Tax=Saimiri boliviensis TaxID=27679 RepID=UPI003D780011